MKSVAILVLLLGIAGAYRKSHSHSHSRHRKASHHHRKCPDPFQKKIMPDSTDIHEHHFNKSAEGYAKLGQGAYPEMLKNKVKLRYPTQVQSLYYYNPDYS